MVDSSAIEHTHPHCRADARDSDRGSPREGGDQAFGENIDDIRRDCPSVDWVELSEVEYARDHEGECVYIKGRIWDVDLDEGILDLSIGYYSATIAIGLDELTETPGRLTEDMSIERLHRPSLNHIVDIHEQT